MKIWIARDEGFILYEYETDDDGINIGGDLHIFYDTPILERVEGRYCDNTDIGYYETAHRKWTCAREMTSNVPKYMFPEIKEGECVEFISKEV